MCSVLWPLKLEARLEVALFGYKLPATCYFHANISINMTIIYILNAFLFIFPLQGSEDCYSLAIFSKQVRFQF